MVNSAHFYITQCTRN